MISPTPDRWDNEYLELIDRTWWLIAVRGWPSGYGLRRYDGTSYSIQEDRHNGTFAIWHVDDKGSWAVYYMTGDGGPGFSLETPEERDRFKAVLAGVRRDMVLDELAMIRLD